MLWDVYWVDTWDSETVIESEVEEAEWYRYEYVRQTAEAWLLHVYHKVTDTELSAWVRSHYTWHCDHYFLVDSSD